MDNVDQGWLSMVNDDGELGRRDAKKKKKKRKIKKEKREKEKYRGWRAGL